MPVPLVGNAAGAAESAALGVSDGVSYGVSLGEAAELAVSLAAGAELLDEDPPQAARATAPTTTRARAGVCRMTRRRRDFMSSSWNDR